MGSVDVAYIGSMNYIYDDEKRELRANLSRSLLDHKRLKHFMINYSLSLSNLKVKERRA